MAIRSEKEIKERLKIVQNEYHMLSITGKAISSIEEDILLWVLGEI